MKPTVRHAVLFSFLFFAGALRAATLVVDGSHKEADDANPGSGEKPFKTISRAALAAAPGDFIEVRGGIYRETVSFGCKGEKDRPVTLRSAAGQRAVITGADILEGWKQLDKEGARGNPNWDKIRVLDLDWMPAQLYEGGKEYRLARLPSAGWWKLTGAEGRRIFHDEKNLVQTDPRAWEGWTVAALYQAGGGITRHTDFTYDPGEHKITLAKDWSPFADIDVKRDIYYMENHVAALTRPLQYAIEKKENGCRLYVWPENSGSGGPPIEGVRRGNAIDVRGARFVVIDGFELRHTSGQLIGHNEPLRDSIIQNCYLHDAKGYGIGLAPERVTIRRCIFREVSHGIALNRAVDCSVEENDIGWCLVDGMIAAGGVRNLRIERNYIHDNFRFGHPDNIQFWTDCEGILIKDNVLINGGQSMMSENMRNLRIINNVYCGSHAVSMIVGGESGSRKRVDGKVIDPAATFADAPEDGITITGNTICATGLSPTGLHGKGITFRNNIVAPLSPLVLYGIRDPGSFKADYNLLWNQAVGGRALVGTDRMKSTANTQEEIREKFGLEVHGIVAEPGFVNAPQSYLVSDYRRIAEFTRTRLFSNGKIDGRVAVGDVVEIAFDGVPRKAVEVGEDFIVFDKPLDEIPEFVVSIANWGAQTDLNWDLRLKEGSPGKKAAEDGGDMGCRLNIRHYIQGDFNGDGKRDLPDFN